MDKPLTRVNPDRLLRLLLEQRDHYRRLRALSDGQRGAVSSDRPEALLSILRERQELVTALTQLHEQLAPYRNEWDSVYEQLPEQVRGQASELLSETNGLLQFILRADQEDSHVLQARKQAVAQSLSELSGARVVSAAYQQRSDAPGVADWSA